MPNVQLPAINQNVCMGWNEAQRDLYHHMPFYLAEMQVNHRKKWSTWPKLCGKIPWQPNMGEVMKAVRKEPSPVIRQHAFPRELSAAATKDIMDVRETSNITTVKHHKFESPIFQFYPSFRDFMKNHVEVHSKDILEKQQVFEDMFLRSSVFNYAPFVFLPDAAAGILTLAPSEPGTDDGAGGSATGKTAAWLQANLPLIGNPGNLSLTTINLMSTIMANDLGIPQYSGSNNNNDVSGQGLGEKFILITSAEAYNQFFFDPWMLAHKNCYLDVVTDGFKGNLWGQVTCKLERYPMRIAADGSFPAPETRVVGAAHEHDENAAAPYNVGETIPNPTYTSAPYEVAFLCGESGYDAVTVGPPPKVFAGNGMPDGFGKMQWNGEIILTKNFLIPCVDAAGVTVYETNAYGEFIRFISHATYGIMPKQRRNFIPIIFKRVRGVQA